MFNCNNQKKIQNNKLRLLNFTILIILNNPNNYNK